MHNYNYKFDESDTKLHTDVVLKVTEEQYLRMRALYEVSEDMKCEVLALGQVELDVKSGEATLIDFFVPKQKCSSTECEMDNAAQAKMIMDGIKVNFWLHTHPDMGSFWSGTDDDTAINELRGKADFFLSIVLGKDQTHRIRIDFELPIPATIDKIKLQIGEIDESSNPFYDDMEVEFKANVKKTKVYANRFGYGKGNEFINSKDTPIYGTPEWWNKYYPQGKAAVPGAEGARDLGEEQEAEVHHINSKKKAKRDKKRRATKKGKSKARASYKKRGK